MPGSSLWLIPPPSTPLHEALQHLIIRAIPSLSPLSNPPQFAPHITLTADTVPPFPDTSPATDAPSSSPSAAAATSVSAAQKWLDSLRLAPTLHQLRVQLGAPQTGSPFFRKLSLRVHKSAELVALAAYSRAGSGGVEGTGSEQQQQQQQQQQQSEEAAANEQQDQALESALEWAARDYEDDGAAKRGGYGPHLSLMYSDIPMAEVQAKLEAVTDIIRTARAQTLGSEKAQGGEIWLVPTERPVAEWQPIARRRLPETVEWVWET